VTDPVIPHIRAEMRAQGVTQREMADRLQISEKHLSMMLNGRAGLSLPMLRRMFAELDLELVIARPVTWKKNPDD
jgi:transcriptional regulator with XRE-family HTH domain